MPRVTFQHPDGREETHDARVGNSVLDCALENAVAGLLGQCGGAATCGTCQCYVEVAWWPLLPPADEVEQELLPYLFDPRESSRLACQIRLTEALDGIRVQMPVRQV